MLKATCILTSGARQQVGKLSTLIVEDTYGNPIAVIMEIQPGHEVVITPNDGEDFHKTLRSLGINKMLFTEPLNADISPQKGDITIINCGRDKYFDNNPDASRVFGQKPGLDPSVLEFLYKYDSAVLGSDFDEAPFNDTYPTQTPLHAIATPYMGLPTIWNLDLNRLKEKCTEYKRNDFLFIVNPLIIKGGTGSIVNPIAIF